jgi:hypothetical protein
MSVCVFLGPSLPLDAARGALDVTYLPPAKRGDIMAALDAHSPRAIGLIDGYFEQAPSVWHKEILYALDRGVPVFGAASIGALRAAELAQFGMTGVGRIYQAYVAGRFDPFDDPFEDDGEVAVAHGPAELGWTGTVALVDVRATLAAARDADAVDDDGMRAALAVAKGVFYKDRSWARLIRDLPPELAAWLPANRVSQKRLDALDLLARLAGPVEAGRRGFRFERTALWEQAFGETAPEAPWPSR